MATIYAEVINGLVDRLVTYPDTCAAPTNPPNVSNAFIQVPAGSAVVPGYTYDVPTNTFAPPAPLATVQAATSATPASGETATTTTSATPASGETTTTPQHTT